MIALPNYLLSDKIATPNKAGTLKGVSPISSCRNVMVKVKDTVSFIEAARAVHGDKYDYSSTVWTKANDPVSFKCNCCSRVIELHTARKHIYDKKTGCGKCYRQPTKPKKIRDELRNRPCKVCGNKINSTDANKVTCSVACGRVSMRAERHLVACCNCGKTVEKYKSQARENNCCSLKCQNEWALITNKGSRETDWLRRSANAQKRWKKEARKQRLKDSLYWSWLVSIREQLANVKPLPKQDPWLVAINTRFVSAVGRDVVKRQSISISGSVEKALARVDIKRKYFDKPEWDKKLGNKLSSLSSRRRRKKNAKGIKDCCGNEETRGLAIQMCFDWMEDNSSVL